MASNKQTSSAKSAGWMRSSLADPRLSGRDPRMHRRQIIGVDPSQNLFEAFQQQPPPPPLIPPVAPQPDPVVEGQWLPPPEKRPLHLEPIKSALKKPGDQQPAPEGRKKKVLSLSDYLKKKSSDPSPKPKSIPPPSEKPPTSILSPVVQPPKRDNRQTDRDNDASALRSSPAYYCWSKQPLVGERQRLYRFREY